MEYSIAKLLQEFEQGRTASTVRAASTVPSDAKGFKAIAVNYISYQVADYAKTRDATSMQICLG